MHKVLNIPEKKRKQSVWVKSSAFLILLIWCLVLSHTTETTVIHNTVLALAVQYKTSERHKINATLVQQ